MQCLRVLGEEDDEHHFVIICECTLFVLISISAIVKNLFCVIRESARNDVLCFYGTMKDDRQSEECT